MVIAGDFLFCQEYVQYGWGNGIHHFSGFWGGRGGVRAEAEYIQYTMDRILQDRQLPMKKSNSLGPWRPIRKIATKA